jgi:hypothetical protein
VCDQVWLHAHPALHFTCDTGAPEMLSQAEHVEVTHTREVSTHLEAVPTQVRRLHPADRPPLSLSLTQGRPRHQTLPLAEGI